MRVVIFARVSRDSSGEGRSVEEQVAHCTDWAKAEGWTVIATVREFGSASKYSTRKRRPELDEVLSWIRGGHIDAVLTWEHSRASRTLSDFVTFRDACVKAGVLWGYNRKLHNLGDEHEGLSTGLDALLAEKEAAQISARIRRATRANADAGKPHGKLLYGHSRVYDTATRRLIRTELDPVAAAVVEEAAERVLNGESLHSIAKDFNKRHIPPRRPKTNPQRKREGWNGEALKQMLTNPSYAGLRQHRGEIVGPADWPAIISLERWERIQARLIDRTRQRSDAWEVKHLLTGIAQCGRPGCGSLVRAGKNASRAIINGVRTRTHYLSYTCSTEFHTSIKMAYLDAIVSEHILERLSREDFLSQLAEPPDSEFDDERAAILSEIAAIHEWLDQVGERAAAERNLELLFDQQRRAKPRLDELQRKLQARSRLSPRVVQFTSADDIRGAWAGMSVQDRREVIRSLVDVRVAPAAQRGAKGIAQAIERTQIIWRTYTR